MPLMRLILIGLLCQFIPTAKAQDLSAELPITVTIGENGHCIAERRVTPEGQYYDVVRPECLNTVEPDAGIIQDDGWKPPPMPDENYPVEMKVYE